MADDNTIALLIAERDGYAQRGLTDRVKEVERVLALHGCTAATPAARATKRPAARTSAKETR